MLREILGRAIVRKYKERCPDKERRLRWTQLRRAGSRQGDGMGPTPGWASSRDILAAAQLSFSPRLPRTTCVRMSARVARKVQFTGDRGRLTRRCGGVQSMSKFRPRRPVRRRPSPMMGPDSKKRTSRWAQRSPRREPYGSSTTSSARIAGIDPRRRTCSGSPSTSISSETRSCPSSNSGSSRAGSPPRATRSTQGTGLPRLGLPAVPPSCPSRASRARAALLLDARRPGER
jgi:hypothetical protein